ncbi:MAG TPA: hypothetical protein DEV81_17560 [Cyanobacteria bacterium UBA11049]|nr:hypothetical protein [Cyanobacteria bacterium UBA11049]
MNSTIPDLRNEVRQLADEAFHRKLISGYGDGPNDNEYQIVFNGKPRHFSLEHARSFLQNLIKQPNFN